MTKSIPGYLKLHREDETGRPPAKPGESDRLKTAFEGATGWRLAGRDGRLVVETQLRSEPSRREQAERLAELLEQMRSELTRTRETLWHREAELAAGVPVTLREDEDTHLALRLESVIKGGAEAIGCQAAALYVLDDATTQLKMRSQWRLPAERYLDPPRQLRGAVADLEALLGHAVAIEDTRLSPHWKCPEAFPAALCLPVATPSTPLGTLWLFSDEPRLFGDEQINVAEIVAGRIACDLERTMLLEQGQSANRVQNQISRAATWQAARIPQIRPRMDNWELAGWRADTETVGGDFYDWCITPDGRLAVAVVSAHGYGMEASLNAASTHALYKAHAAYAHQPKQLLSRINDSLWTSSPGDQHASMIYAMIDPQANSVQYSLTRGPLAVSLRGAKYKSLSADVAPLGEQPDTRFVAKTHRAEVGEGLVLLSESMRTARVSGRPLDERIIAKAVRSFGAASAEQLAVELGDWLDARVDPNSLAEGSFVVLRRVK